MLLFIGGERSGWSHSHLFLDAIEFFPKFGIIALELLHSPCCPFNLGRAKRISALARHARVSLRRGCNVSGVGET